MTNSLQASSTNSALLLATKEAEKRLYLRDLYGFNHDVLGYHEMAPEPHREMCQSVTRPGKKRKLRLYPRGHFKSSMITVGDATRRVCKDPNLRILIGNLSLGNAKSFLREIKGHFERGAKLRELYGDHVSDARSDAGKWSETQIVSRQRTKNLKEPTIQVAGVGQSLASQHYDVMYLDDLLDQLSVTTQEQIQKTIEWYKLAISLLEPDGELIIIGTRYHDADLYGYIIKNLSEEFDIEVHGAIDGDGQPIFPSRFTLEVLAAIRKEQGSYIYSCQYLNEPVDDETAKFKASNFRYFQEEQMVGRQVFTSMTVDRAYSLNKTADFTGITIRSVDIEGHRLVRYAKRHKQSEGEIINAIFNLKNFYKVDRVGIEQKAFEHTLKPTLDAEMRRRGDFFTVVELKDQSSKILRIESLVPLFESNSVYFIDGEMTDLEDELTRFPRAPHDDLADSLAYHETPEMKGSPANPGYAAKIAQMQQAAIAGEL